MSHEGILRLHSDPKLIWTAFVASGTFKELAGLLNRWRWRFGPKPAAKNEFIDDWV